MLVGILIFMLSFFVTSFAEQFTVFLIGMIILTLVKCLFGSSTNYS